MELSHFHRIFCYRVLYSSFWICCLCFMFLAGGFCSFHQIFSIIIVILCVCVLCVGVCYSVYLLWIKFQYRLLISFASAMAMWKEYIGKVSVFSSIWSQWNWAAFYEIVSIFLYSRHFLYVQYLLSLVLHNFFNSVVRTHDLCTYCNVCLLCLLWFCLLRL